MIDTLPPAEFAQREPDDPELQHRDRFAWFELIAGMILGAVLLWSAQGWLGLAALVLKG